jgi:hypothetical protein
VPRIDRGLRASLDIAELILLAGTSEPHTGHLMRVTCFATPQLERADQTPYDPTGSRVSGYPAFEKLFRFILSLERAKNYQTHADDLGRDGNDNILRSLHPLHLQSPLIASPTLYIRSFVGN